MPALNALSCADDAHASATERIVTLVLYALYKLFLLTWY